MARIAVLGAGVMGTALTFPLSDNGHDIRLIGTHLDDAIIALKKIARNFAITLGADGALVFDGVTLHNIAPFHVKAIDTNGAGDMFAGAFLFGITQGKDFATAGKLASRAAAGVVSDYGPRMSSEQQQQLLAELQFI